jgi:hypothetical protein
MRTNARRAVATQGLLAAALAVVAIAVSALLIQWVAGVAVAAPSAVVVGSFRAAEGADYGAAAVQRVAPQRRP